MFIYASRRRRLHNKKITFYVLMQTPRIVPSGTVPDLFFIFFISCCFFSPFRNVLTRRQDGRFPLRCCNGPSHFYRYEYTHSNVCLRRRRKEPVAEVRSGGTLVSSVTSSILEGTNQQVSSYFWCSNLDQPSFLSLLCFLVAKIRNLPFLLVEK